MAGSSYNLIDGAAASNHRGWAQPAGLDFNAQYYNSNTAISPPSPALSVLFIGNNTGEGGTFGDRGIIDTRDGTVDWGTERGFTLNVRDDDYGANQKLGGLFFSVGTGSCRVNRPVKNIRSRRRVLCSWKGGEAPRIFIDGGEVLYDAQAATTSYAAGRSTFIVGAYYDHSSVRRFYGNMDFLSVIYEDLSTHAEMLHETPYALLMPVARPFIFDMAGGGGVYTIGKAGFGYSGAPLYGSLFSEIPSLTSSLSGKDAKGSTTAKPQKASLAFSGQEASTGLLTTIGRSISNFAGQSITIGIVSGTIVSVGQAVFSFVGNAAKGGIKSVIAKFGLTSSTGEVKGNTTTSTPSVGFTYQGNEAKANTKATVDSKSFGLNGRGVIVNGVAEIIRRAVKIIGSSLRRIIG
jgi:hypothetical protein